MRPPEPEPHPADDDSTIETRAPELFARIEISDSEKTIAASAEDLDRLATTSRRSEPAPPLTDTPTGELPTARPPPMGPMKPLSEDSSPTPVMSLVVPRMHDPDAPTEAYERTVQRPIETPLPARRGQHRVLPLLVGGGILYVAMMAWLVWLLAVAIARAFALR